MQFHTITQVRCLCVLVASLLVLVLGVEEVWAQAETKWLNIGDFHHQYSSTGGEPSCCIKKDGQFWPGLYKRMPNQGAMVRTALWIGAEGFTDERGQTFQQKVVHAGPRDFGLSEFFPKPMRLVSRFEVPEVTVDGLQSFDKPVIVTEVDPNLEADRMIVREANTQLGITMKNRVLAWGQEYHDDYHVHEYTFTNTGNVDGDPEIELPDQTLEGVYFYFAVKYQIWQGESIIKGGANTMSDYVGDGMEDYGVPYRAFFSWYGNVPWEKGNALGAPVWTDDNSNVAEGDSVGRLAAAWMASRAILHADKSTTDRSDDPAQPAHTGFIRGGDPITNGNDAFNTEQMAQEYAYMDVDQKYSIYPAGHEYPHHADLVAPTEPQGDWLSTWYERMANQVDDPRRSHIGGGGWVPNMAFGPYTLEPGESINLVWIEGFAGLDTEASIEIGKAYKRSGGDDALLIEYDADGSGQIEDDERLTKNYWVLSSRDSVFKMVEKATLNRNSGYAIPRPPMPPRNFHVRSGADKITLEWDTFGENPPGGFEIYRTRNRLEGAIEDDWQYQKIASLGPGERRYEDTDVIRGISYYYYIQAIGGLNQDPTGLTPTGVPLKSSRYYTQTYDPAFLKREPGQSLEAVRVVPNPYHLGASKDVRWPDQQDKLAFLNIPGNCTLRIYSEIGELIEVIDHSEGSGDAYWNLTTSSNQVVVSGIYYVVIQDRDTGDQIIRNFVVIR